MPPILLSFYPAINTGERNDDVLVIGEAGEFLFSGQSDIRSYALAKQNALIYWASEPTVSRTSDQVRRHRADAGQ